MAKILIVDDTLVMRINLRKILEDADHEVVGEAENGLKAIEMVDKLKPDLITMDITMPEMSGIDALRRILKKYPSARVVMISALSQKVKVLEALNLGAKHYIVKPFKKNQVVEIIESVLEESGYLSEEDDEKDEPEQNDEDIYNEIDKSKKEDVLEFIVQNREGTYVLLPREVKGKWLPVIIEKLIRLKNPKVVINISEVKALSIFMFEELVKAVEKIKKARGSIEIYANMDVIKVFEGRAGYKMLLREVNKYF